MPQKQFPLWFDMETIDLTSLHKSIAQYLKSDRKNAYIPSYASDGNVWSFKTTRFERIEETDYAFVCGKVIFSSKIIPYKNHVNFVSLCNLTNTDKFLWSIVGGAAADLSYTKSYSIYSGGDPLFDGNFYLLRFHGKLRFGFLRRIKGMFDMDVVMCQYLRGGKIDMASLEENDIGWISKGMI